MSADHSLEQFPMPGTEASEGDKAIFLERFLQGFRNPRAHGGMLTWNSWHLPESPQSRLLGVEEMGRLDADLFATRTIAAYDELLVYFETPRRLFQASPAQIRSYLRSRNPWDDFDLYVFPKSMEWCIALTHDLPNGIGTFVAGEAVKWDLANELPRAFNHHDRS